MNDNLAYSYDIKSPTPKQQAFKKLEIFWLGIIIGAGVVISIAGIIQYFSYISEVNIFLRKVWFNRPWWVWIPPLLFFLGLFGYIRYRIAYSN